MKLSGKTCGIGCIIRVMAYLNGFTYFFPKPHPPGVRNDPYGMHPAFDFCSGKKRKEYPFIIKGSTAALKNDEAQNEITVRFLNLTNPGILMG